MYPTFTIRQAPCAGRQAARRAPHHARHLSGGPGFPLAVFGGSRPHSFFGPPAPHHPQGTPRGNDVFDHFDDFVNRSFEGLFPHVLGGPDRARAASPVWQPRFDVQEVESAYQLRGELPGVEAQDLEVEFSDENTLVVRGRTASARTQDDRAPTAPLETPPAQQESGTAAAAAAQDDDAASVHSDNSYVQPTVEDEETSERRESVGTESVGTEAAPQAENTAAQPQKQAPQPKYWVSERSTGSFSRTFEFPGRVDAAGVTASLKNGILDVSVPKASAPAARRINVQ